MKERGETEAAAGDRASRDRVVTLRDRSASSLRAAAAGKAVSRLEATEFAAGWVAVTGSAIAPDLLSDRDVE